MSTRIKKICGAFFVFIALVLIMLVIFDYNTKPVSKTSVWVSHEVLPDSHLNGVLEDLDQEGIIRSAFFTRVKALTMPQSTVYAGVYTLNKAWSSGEILKHLSNSGNVSKGNEVSVLIKEGSWAKDFARLISEQVMLEETDLLNLWNDREYVQSLIDEYDYLPQEIMDNKDAIVLLEGFLYPDTYRFYIDASADDITRRILDNAQSKYALIMNDIKASGMSVYDTVTLASIVEYEANQFEDMQMIAGVFKNRLAIDMKLQSSVTVCYALYEFDSWLDCESSKNNQYDSPYNTYVVFGLPPGPILNSSTKALTSVIKSIDSDYLFFIADVYGDGTVYFSEDYEQHKKYIEQFLK